MSEPQTFDGLMWQIHELKQQIADAEKRGAVKALRREADQMESVDPGVFSHSIWGLRARADDLESGRVTL